MAIPQSIYCLVEGWNMGEIRAQLPAETEISIFTRFAPENNLLHIQILQAAISIEVM
jgi:hypothetical protein